MGWCSQESHRKTLGRAYSRPNASARNIFDLTCSTSSASAGPARLQVERRQRTILGDTRFAVDLAHDADDRDGLLGEKLDPVMQQFPGQSCQHMGGGESGEVENAVVGEVLGADA